MSEVAGVGFDDYLWGDEVRTVFAALGRGFSLATALHAATLDEAFSVITRENRVPDDQAARIDLMVYIRSIGHWSRPTRRAVAEVHEIQSVSAGRPQARLLHRWDEAADRFEAVEQPARIGSLVGTYENHLRTFAS
jgi:hypothetical protein